MLLSESDKHTLNTFFEVDHLFCNPAETQELRVCGNVEIIIDEVLEARLYTERPWLKAIEDISSEVKLIMFKITQAEAYIWDMGHNLREQDIPR